MKQKRVLLLGLGMQGQAALHDLAESGEVGRILVADSRAELKSLLARYPADLVQGVACDAGNTAEVQRLMRGVDVVVEALPVQYTAGIGRLAVECGVSLVSSMYYPGDVVEIDRLAKSKGVTLLSEFGLDPGLDLVLAARAISELDEVREFYCYGAGLPAAEARGNPLAYKFSWSPAGVMWTYRRPGRVISGGEAVDIAPDALFEARHRHEIEVPALGTRLECFANGDGVQYAEMLGIRPTVRESGRYTGRLPGHCVFWDTMAKSGFLNEQPVRVGGQMVAPAAFTAALLSSQEQFQYVDGERDLTFLRVDARGLRRGKWVRIVYELIDYRDLRTGFTSMQRTVGFTMSFGARLILGGQLAKCGLLTALDVSYDAVIGALEKHGIRVTRVEGSE